nr:hypothetical protein [Streptomyces sp. RLB1-33]QIY67943.1 hypothetical protein HEP84_43060 [Streptomyces sp. RLB1-33]
MDQLAQFVGQLVGPGLVGTELGGRGEIAQHVGQAQPVIQLAQLGAVVWLVAVMDGDRARFEVLQHSLAEGAHQRSPSRECESLVSDR